MSSGRGRLNRRDKKRDDDSRRERVEGCILPAGSCSRLAETSNTMSRCEGGGDEHTTDRHYHASESLPSACSLEAASAASSASGSSAMVSGGGAASFSFSAAPTWKKRSISTSGQFEKIASRLTLDEGFLEPAREAGFLAADDGGFADARDAGFALAAREAGFAEAARDALEAGLEVVPAALLVGLVAALEAGFAYPDVASTHGSTRRVYARTFFAGGSSPFTTGASSSASLSAAVRLRPFVDLGFSPPSAAGSFAFLVERGFAAAFLGAGSDLGRSLMRAERRGSPASAGCAAFRGISEGERDVERDREGMVGVGGQDATGRGCD